MYQIGGHVVTEKEGSETRRTAQFAQRGAIEQGNMKNGQASYLHVSLMLEHTKMGTKPTWKEVAPSRAESNVYWAEGESLQV